MFRNQITHYSPNPGLEETITEKWTFEQGFELAESAKIVLPTGSGSITINDVLQALQDLGLTKQA